MSAGVCPSCGKTYPRSTGHCSNDGTRLVEVAPPQQHEMVGKILDKRYEVGAWIATGRIGTMYRGVQLQLGREVAIKIIHPSFANDTASGDRFVDAARAACQLVAPSVQNVYDVGRTKDGILYVVSELVKGETLGKKGLSIRRVVAIAMQVCDALDAAHRQNVVHGDLKPSNVFIDESTGRIAVKVVDFGLAHALAPDVAIADPRRALPLYAAPERFAGRAIDARTDLYAVGCILYELLAGRPPFEAPTLDALAAKHHRDAPPPLPPNVPTALLAIVQKLLAKSPQARYTSCKELRSALLPIQAQVGDPAPTRMTPPSGAPYATREPTTPPTTPPSFAPTTPPTTPPSTPPTAVVPPLPLAQPPRSRILLIVAIVLVLGGGGIAVLIATQGL